MTVKEYAESYKVLLKQGHSIESLNKANHIGLESGKITLEMFLAAAQVLVNTYLAK